ncbi:hypothetical protein BH09PAT2_BH09PAT2_09260 [soil metagenome]
MKKIIFAFSLILLLFITSKTLLPGNTAMFMAHDETQAARIQQFQLNIHEGNIPPRIAPDFSFGLGYPIFNYYAPFPYWVAFAFQSLGLPLISAMKMTYVLAIIVGFSSIFLLLKRLFTFYPAVLGGLIYATSPYIAVDIYVRGNMGETWVFALLPLALYMLLTNSKKRFIFTAFILSFLFTSHNILSLISLLLVSIFSVLVGKKLLNILSVGFGLLLSSYFLIPAALELHQVQATNIATKTNYADHFLCLSQVWSSLWGYAGSAPGCTADGMSFMLGKLPILLGIAGILIFIYYQYIYKPKKHLVFINNQLLQIVNRLNDIFPFFSKDEKLPITESKNIYLFVLLTTIVSLYLTTYASAWFWNLFHPIFSLFQFPWRFLMFTLFGLSFFTAYSLSYGSKKIQMIGTLAVVFLIFLIHPKYFVGQTISNDEFTKRYLSSQYIKNSVAYKVAEYLPTSVNFEKWKTLEKNPKKANISSIVVNNNKKQILAVEEKPFSHLFMAKSVDPVIANIHYAPYWKISRDYVEFIPSHFDDLGRPYIPVSDRGYTSVQIKYEQTSIEIFANLLSILASVILIGFTLKQYTLTWKNTIIKKK